MAHKLAYQISPYSDIISIKWCWNWSTARNWYRYIWSNKIVVWLAFNIHTCGMTL